MAKRAAHDALAIGCGAVAASYFGAGENRTDLVLEAIGGALGGWVGGRLPDLLNPPTSPRHRTWAHGVVPASAAGSTIVRLELIAGWQAHLRAEADRLAKARLSLIDRVDQLWNAFLELVCRLLAGAAPGLVVGYFSHLILDAATPAGLPLIA